jgi:hypothetical protein
MKTMAQLKAEMIKRYGTASNITSEFTIGTKVKVITPCQDFHFFYGETGEVVENKNCYLGIIVKFDKPRHFENGMIQKTFNFEPNDLIKIPEYKDCCPFCGKPKGKDAESNFTAS